MQMFVLACKTAHLHWQAAILCVTDTQECALLVQGHSVVSAGVKISLAARAHSQLCHRTAPVGLARFEFFVFRRAHLLQVIIGDEHGFASRVVL